jgi:hypothetical protein
MSPSAFAIVRWGDSTLLTRRTVLEELGLTDGERITEGQMRRIVVLNCAAFVADMELAALAGQPSTDVSDLKARLATARGRASHADK